MTKHKLDAQQRSETAPAAIVLLAVLATPVLLFACFALVSWLIGGGL